MVNTEEIITNEPLLFTSLQIGSVTLKNRICISPMCQYSCTDGFVHDWHMVHLGARAIGGAALVMMEATAVEERGRISQFCPGIWKDEHLEPMKRITQFIKTQNCIPAIQLAHAGRKGSTFPPYISRDAVPVDQGGWDDIIAPSSIGEFSELEAFLKVIKLFHFPQHSVQAITESRKKLLLRTLLHFEEPLLSLQNEPLKQGLRSSSYTLLMATWCIHFYRHILTNELMSMEALLREELDWQLN